MFLKFKNACVYAEQTLIWNTTFRQTTIILQFHQEPLLPSTQREKGEERGRKGGTKGEQRGNKGGANESMNDRKDKVIVLYCFEVIPH